MRSSLLTSSASRSSVVTMPEPVRRRCATASARSRLSPATYGRANRRISGAGVRSSSRETPKSVVSFGRGGRGPPSIGAPGAEPRVEVGREAPREPLAQRRRARPDEIGEVEVALDVALAAAAGQLGERPVAHHLRERRLVERARRELARVAADRRELRVERGADVELGDALLAGERVPDRDPLEARR